MRAKSRLRRGRPQERVPLMGQSKLSPRQRVRMLPSLFSFARIDEQHQMASAHNKEGLTEGTRSIEWEEGCGRFFYCTAFESRNK